MLLNTKAAITQTFADKILEEKRVKLSVLRLDLVHPVASGNKLFKLHYFLQQALRDRLPGIVTFGGAWSNHLVATACACRDAGLASAGIVRGEQPTHPSATLVACIAYGMKLHFVSREQYDQKEAPGFVNEVLPACADYLQVPEGGFSEAGASGASLIMDLINEDITHIACAAGTATTLAGIFTRLQSRQQLIAIPVLKNINDLSQRIKFLTGRVPLPTELMTLDNYHFGGYAKKTPALITFMNELFLKQNLPTDFVYTGKMMFGVMDAITQNRFPPNAHILCLHTGGLQGNLSLPKNELLF